MKATPTLSLIHDVASLNPYCVPLQTGAMRDLTHCTFCGNAIHTLHDPSCLWLRAITLFAELVPIDDYRADDYCKGE